METPIKTQLEVGDKIVKYGRAGMSIETVDRVTPKRAFTKSKEFKRELTAKQCTAESILDDIGGGSIGYRLWVKEYHEPKFEKQNLEVEASRLLNSITVYKMSNETLKKLIELLTPKA